MSPSPSGPGSWTRASTPAGRETSGVRISGAQRRRQSFAERFNCGLARSAAEANLKGLKQRPLIRDGRGNDLDDNILQKIRN